MTCPACGGSRTRSLFEHLGFGIRSCGGCDHVWAAGGPAAYETDPSLLQRYKDDEHAHRALMRRSLRQVRPWIPEGGRVLDFGCGPGLFVLEARAAGYDCVGVDLAGWVPEAAAHWDVPLHAVALEDAPFAPESFDAIVSIVTYEHLDDPRAVTRALARLLKPGGTLAVVSVPHSRGIGFRLLRERWWDLAPPGHLQYFSRRSLRRLLEGQGLAVVKTFTTGVGTQFFSRLLRRGGGATALDALQLRTNSGESPPGGGAMRWLASRLVVPALNRCLDVTGLGNNLTMIARKGGPA